MTPAAFLQLAPSLPGVSEGVHQAGPDLRVAGKVFASPAVRPGGWDLKGATWFYPKHADAKMAEVALWMAWRNPAPKRLIKRHAT